MDWISVKDRLPDRKEDVYLCCIGSLAFPGTQYIRILKFYGDGTWGHGGNVTHWMPLPEPPKGDKKMNKPLYHEAICQQLNDLYRRKNADYGDSFGKSFAEYGMAMPCIRLEDKLNRLKALTRKGDAQVQDESITDTLLDLANYAIMTVIEMQIAADNTTAPKED